MGNFLAVTAFANAAVNDVTAAITDYMRSYGVPSESVPVASPCNDGRDAQIYPPVNGWTVVLWPSYFNIHDRALARSVASTRNWVVSTIGIYDDEYWEHHCFAGSTELHAFCSRPHFWEDEAPEDFQRMMSINAEPSRLATVFGISPEVIRPYFADVDELADPEAKAYAEDEIALGDFWVFSDFWRRLGITYPTPPENLAAVLRLGLNVQKKLPTS